MKAIEEEGGRPFLVLRRSSWQRSGRADINYERRLKEIEGASRNEGVGVRRFKALDARLPLGNSEGLRRGSRVKLSKLYITHCPTVT